MLSSSKLNLTWISLNFNLNFNLSFHWTADTQTRGKLGNEEADLIPSTRNIPRTLQQWWRLNSRNAMVQRLKQLMSALAEEGWVPESNNERPYLPLPLVFHLELPLLWRPVNILSILPGSAQTHSPTKPSWTQSLPAGFLRLCIHFFWRTCPILLNNLYACT